MVTLVEVEKESSYRPRKKKIIYVTQERLKSNIFPLPVERLGSVKIPQR